MPQSGQIGKYAIDNRHTLTLTKSTSASHIVLLWADTSSKIGERHTQYLSGFGEKGKGKGERKNL
jgi:hypothetical protein